MVCVGHLKSRQECTDTADMMCASDLLAFSLFFFLARRSKATGLKVRLILDIIAEDAMWYFLVIFSSHFVLVLTLNFARVSAIVSPQTRVDDDHRVSL